MKVIESENYSSIKKLRKYMKRYSIPIFLNILLAMISSAVSSAPLALIKRLFDKGIIESNEKDILYAAGSMILLAVVGAVLVYWNTVFSALISASIYKNIVDDIYIKIQTLDMEYFSSAKIGELMTKVITDPNNINSVIKETFNMIPEVFKVVICFGLALSIDWKLTLGILIVAPVLITIVKKYSKKLKRSGKKRQEAMGLINSKLQESLSGIRVIKAFAMEKEEIRDFRIKNTKLKRIAIQTAKYNARSSAVSEALNYIMIAGLLLAGGYRVLRGHDFTPGDFVTIMGAISSMYTPIRRAITRFNEISVDIPSVGRVFEILEEEPKIIDNENKILFQYFSDNITFENVDFKYKDSDEKILKNINFTVKKGETMAFVGNSGGGKSTLVNLIPRFFDVSNGAIKIDGVNIKDYDVKSLRKNIGIVPQETFLFSGTILQNIKYGKRDATFEEIEEAAKKANAHEFIKKLEDGYNTEIGERGVKLSGGQKQRIAIARAILENPQILILDEAMAAVDSENEKLINEAIEELRKNKTVITIAHHLNTVQNADKIIVMDKGLILDSGTHEELISRCAFYKEMVEAQNKVDNWRVG